MERLAILPLIIYDLTINVWLTALFVVPLRNLYSHKHNPNSRLHSVTKRTFLGSCFALTSSVVNLSVVTILKGEPAWLCLMCCNSDILFSTIVVHWVTSRDPQSCIADVARFSTGVEAGRCGRCGRGSDRTQQGSYLATRGVVLSNISAHPVHEEGGVIRGEGRDSHSEGSSDLHSVAIKGRKGAID